MPDLLVTFMVTAGNGSLATPQPVLTDAQGQAEAVLTVGTQAGANQVTVTRPRLTPVMFNVMGQADRDHARLLPVSGNIQEGRAGAELPAPLVVRLEDQFGNPLVGEHLTAALLRGAGELRTTTR